MLFTFLILEFFKEDWKSSTCCIGTQVVDIVMASLIGFESRHLKYVN